MTNIEPIKHPVEGGMLTAPLTGEETRAYQAPLVQKKYPLLWYVSLGVPFQNFI